jgi:hypothetical protein
MEHDKRILTPLILGEYTAKVNTLFSCVRRVFPGIVGLLTKRRSPSAGPAYLCFSPVKSQSTDFPNSFVIASNTAAPGSFSPFSRAER